MIIQAILSGKGKEKDRKRKENVMEEDRKKNRRGREGLKFDDGKRWNSAGSC